MRAARILIPLATLIVAGAFVGAAWAHARISPAVSLSHQLQLYSLTVPTEKAGVATTDVTLIVPTGFSIDSFVPTPGWKRKERSTGAGGNAVVQRVSWSDGHVPTGDDAFFQFLAEPSGSGTYTFKVEQTYSDGSIVDWTGPESSDSPAPSVQAVSSFGGGSGGSSTVAIVAIVVGAAGVLLGAVALLARGDRPLA